MRHSRIYSQNGMISDTVGYKRVRRNSNKKWFNIKDMKKGGSNESKIQVCKMWSRK